jgi:methionine aminotransferase
MNNHPTLPPSKLPEVGTTIFTEMSALALECGALNIAQGFPDLETPPALRHAVSTALEEGHNQYAPMAGNRDLRRWIAESYHAGAGYNPDSEITVGAGASSVLFAAMTALLQPGDEVVVQDPGYDLYIPVAELNQAHVVRVPLLDSHGNMNADGLANAIGPRTRLVILNSPHNPTGRVTTAAMLDALADAMEGTDVWLLSDEVYGPMVHDGRDAPVPWRHDKLRPRTLVAGSFGKLFHCTGWKVGWVAAPAKLTTELRKVHQYDVFSTAAPIQAGLVQYLTTPEAHEHLGTVGPIYEAKRNRLLRGLEGTSFTWIPAEGGYFQVVGVGAYVKPGETDGDLARRWTREHGIATIPMGSFGDSWEPAVRLCFAKEDATLDRAVELLRAIPSERNLAGHDHAGHDHAFMENASLGDPKNSNLGELHVLAVQADLMWQDPEANRQQFETLVGQQLHDRPSHLVVLPEMFTTGFDMSTPTHRDGCWPWPDVTTQRLQGAWPSAPPKANRSIAFGSPHQKAICTTTTSDISSHSQARTGPMKREPNVWKLHGGDGASCFRFAMICASPVSSGTMAPNPMTSHCSSPIGRRPGVGHGARCFKPEPSKTSVLWWA